VLIGAEAHLPYDRPPLSKQVLAGKWEEAKTFLVDEAALKDLGVETVLGHTAVDLDVESRRIELDDGSIVAPDAVVVATGAKPRRLFPEEGVLVLRTIDDCAALRSAVLAKGEACRVTVIGAGFIGSEVASTCADLGCRVTVLEALPVPLMAALGESVGAALGMLHRRQGVDLRTDAVVVSVHRRLDGCSVVRLTDGTEIEADVVMAGVGVGPEVTWLEDSALRLDNGVVCDESLFAAPGIVAAGDVARWPHRGELVRIEHWQLASEMGDAAASALLAGHRAAAPFVTVPYFWSDQYGEKIQVIGRPSPTDEIVVADGALDDRFVVLYRHGDALSAVAALSRPRQLMTYRPLLAAGASFDEALALARSGG
jgi:NADPH-dependent 2,4-dienoyl-CoA reductase/sulfur reductase-like enzyme